MKTAFLICALALPVISSPKIEPCAEFHAIVQIVKGLYPGYPIYFVEDMELPTPPFHQLQFFYHRYAIYIKGRSAQRSA